MKRTIKIAGFLIAGVYLGFMTAYLGASFLFYDFSPKEWGEDGRWGAVVAMFFFGFVGGLLGAIAGDVATQHENKNE